MKKFILNALGIVSTLLMLYFLLAPLFTPRTVETTKTDTITVVKIDTFVQTIYAPAPKPDTVLDTVYQWQATDTAQILAECQVIANDYYAHRIYNRHLIFDSIGWADIRDTVYQNKLTGYVYNSKFKTYTKETVITKPAPAKISVALGLSGTYTKDSPGFAYSLLLRNKKRQGFALSYDPINKTTSASFYWFVY